MDNILGARMAADHRMVRLPNQRRSNDEMRKNGRAMHRLFAGLHNGTASSPPVLLSTFTLGGQGVKFLTSLEQSRFIIHRLCSCLDVSFEVERYASLEYRSRKNHRVGCATPGCILSPLPDGFNFYGWDVNLATVFDIGTKEALGSVHGMTLWHSPVGTNGGSAFERRLGVLFPEIDPMLFALVGPSLAGSFNRVFQGAFMKITDAEAWERLLVESSRDLPQ